MFSEERILGLRMVEFKARKQFLPSGGGVTFFTTLLKRTFMRIDMAVNARLEFHVFVTRRSTGHIRLVTLFAGNLNVAAR